MYRVMLCKYRMGNYESLYQFATAVTNGVISPVEFDTEEDAREYASTLNYASCDYIITMIVE